MLDLIISLCLIFALFAGIVSSLNELVSQALEMRGRVLFEGVASFMGELNSCGRLRRWFGKVDRTVKSNGDKVSATPLTSLLFQHPLVDSLSQPGCKPSYLDSACFSDTLLNLLKDPLFESQLQDNGIGKLLSGFYEIANGDNNRFKELIETHYDRVMDRVGGWYRRRAKAAMFVISLALAATLNLDALYIFQHLQNAPNLTAELVEAASKTGAVAQVILPETPSTLTNNQVISALEQQLSELNTRIDDFQKLNMPIGWNLQMDRCNLICNVTPLPGQRVPVLGWLIMAFAGTLGAPFWFDLISRLLPLKGKPTPKPSASYTQAAPTSPTSKP